MAHSKLIAYYVSYQLWLYFAYWLFYIGCDRYNVFGERVDMRTWKLFFRRSLTNLLMMGLALAFLVHFGLIVAYGTVVIQEPNVIMLSLEIVLLVGIVILGIYNFIDLIHLGRKTSK